MKKLTLIAAALLVTTSLFAFDFRQVNWEMTKEQVKKAEGNKVPILKWGGDIFDYKGMEVYGMKAELGYSFHNNKLYSAMYTVINADEAVLSRMAKFLSKEIGEPDNRSKGKVSWSTERTDILMYLDNDANLIISYQYADADRIMDEESDD